MSSKISDKEEMLPLMEVFYTLQGEGVNSGMAACFVRLAGCDVGCGWCDIKESWPAEKFPLTSVKSISQTAAKYGAINAVITGGEPLLCNLGALTKELRKKKIKTFLETSGTHPLSGIWDWICLSPKKIKIPDSEIFEKADELKIIIYNKDDFRFAEDCSSKFARNKNLFLQPEWSRREKVLPLIIDYIKAHPKWRLSLQTHKYLGIP